MAMPVEATLAEESEETEDAEEEMDQNSNSNSNSNSNDGANAMEQKQISPKTVKAEYSPPPPPPSLPPLPKPTSLTPTQQNKDLQPTYNCPFCAKPFHARWMLERHLPSHTGQRPYKCMRCERRFSLQSSAVRHVKNVHKNEDFDAEAEASSMVVKDKGGIIGGDGGIGGSGDSGFGASDNLGLGPPLPPIEEVMRVGGEPEVEEAVVDSADGFVIG